MASGFPGYSSVGSAALAASMLASRLDKADAMLVANSPTCYARHLRHALDRFDELAALVAKIRAAQPVKADA